MSERCARCARCAKCAWGERAWGWHACQRCVCEEAREVDFFIAVDKQGVSGALSWLMATLFAVIRT